MAFFDYLLKLFKLFQVFSLYAQMNLMNFSPISTNNNIIMLSDPKIQTPVPTPQQQSHASRPKVSSFVFYFYISVNEHCTSGTCYALNYVRNSAFINFKAFYPRNPIKCLPSMWEPSYGNPKYYFVAFRPQLMQSMVEDLAEKV